MHARARCTRRALSCGVARVQCQGIACNSFALLHGEFPHANIASFWPAYAASFDDVASLRLVPGPNRRPDASRGAHPFIQRHMPTVARDKLSAGEILSKARFAELAVARPPPLALADAFASEQLDADLRAAIDYVARQGDGVVEDRAARMRILRTAAARLEPMRAALDMCKCDTSKEIASLFNVAWASLLTDVLQWPDVRMPLLYVTGFPVVFDIPDSGVFRAEDQPAGQTPAEFKRGNTRMVAKISEEIRKSATTGSAEDRDRRANAWIRTKEEIAEGLVGPPRSRAQLDRKHGRGKWRCLGRNAILQKGKWRCIDNAKRSKHNEAQHLRERLVCGRADFPVVVAREFAKRWQARATYRRASGSGGIHKRSRRLAHGTDDLKAAYRHVPTSQPEYTCVAVWDDDAGQVVYCEVPGHNFGLASAVLNFNRCPELYTAACRQLLGIVNEHFYDDTDVTEPAYAERSGQLCLRELNSAAFLGFPFDAGKHVAMSESSEYLGVETSFERLHAGIITMCVTRKRRDKIADLIDEVVRSAQLRSGLAASIFGKSRFMLSPCYGSLGKACLQPVMQREHEKSATRLTADLADSLEFIAFVCKHLPPLELPLMPTTDTRKVVVFTDAEGKKRRGARPPSGHMGFLVIHPVFGRVHAYARVPDEIVLLLERCRKSDNYIGQWELLAAITPFISLPASWFAGRPIELWIDNAGAVGALIKGYSGKPDCAKIVNLFHFAVAKLGAASLWIDYVNTESNPADVPSRFHEMSADERLAYADLLGDLVPMVVPALCTASGAWLSSVEIASSVWL